MQAETSGWLSQDASSDAAGAGLANPPPAVRSPRKPRRPRLVAVPPPIHSAWPQLEALGLSSAEQGARLAGIGGSDANIILSGDPERILQLWREKRGEAAAPSLKAILPVMLGSWTEAFNRQWYEQQTGQVVDEVGAVSVCQNLRWRRCTLDGLITCSGSVWEAKHVNAFAKTDEVLARYMPQLQHNMAVRGVDRAVLSVPYGNHKWDAMEVAADWLYQDELLAAEAAFWDCVQSGKRPVAEAPPPTPKPIAAREVSLEGSNAWGAAAADWLLHRAAAKSHAQAVKDLKDLVEEDVRRAYGHRVEATRSKSGAVTIKEMGR